MTRRRRRAVVGAALVLLALLYPVRGIVLAWVESHNTRINVALEDGKALQLPVHVARGGYYTLNFEADALPGLAGDNGDGPEDCMLSTASTSPDGLCAGTRERLRFHFRVENARGEVVRGSYEAPLAGQYPDAAAEYGPYFSAVDSMVKVIGCEVVILQELKRGDYVLRVDGVAVPRALLPAHLRLRMHPDGGTFAGLAWLPILLLSLLLGIAGLGFLAVAAGTAKEA